MPWIVYFIAGGGTFLPGAGLIAAAIANRTIFARGWIRTWAIEMVVLGIVLVTISAEAISWWVYLIWTASILAWFLREKLKTRWRKSAIDLVELTITCIAAAIAISFQLHPTLPSAVFPRFYVIGDSISAGIGREEGNTWPHIVGTDHHVQVIDLSRAGATIADATRQLQSESLTDGLVLLEIGGNDMIGRVGPNQFGRDLDALAQPVCGPGRRVVMLELPLFPFGNSYGLQQRRVASHYGILLIPRKYFAQVLASPGATVDGLHLSATGHRRMAQMIWEMVGSSLRATPQ